MTILFYHGRGCYIWGTQKLGHVLDESRGVAFRGSGGFVEGGDSRGAAFVLNEAGCRIMGWVEK